MLTYSDEAQQAIIAEHGVEISIIPDYYYRDPFISNPEAQLKRNTMNIRML